VNPPLYLAERDPLLRARGWVNFWMPATMHMEIPPASSKDLGHAPIPKGTLAFIVAFAGIC